MNTNKDRVCQCWLVLRSRDLLLGFCWVQHCPLHRLCMMA